MKTEAKAIVTVQVIKRKYLEQLFVTRNSVELGACQKLEDDEEVVGNVSGGIGVLIRRKTDNRLRMMWPFNYCFGQGMNPGKPKDQHQYLEKLPQLFVD